MCGIVGYAGYRQAYSILLDSLKRLEYRGYDSAGVAIAGSGITVRKDKGYISHLEETTEPIVGTLGIAHTRWATHGPPSKENAHPHVDCSGDIALIHNGIIENYQELRERLKGQGHVFRSVTITDYEGKAIQREPQRITWTLEDAEKGGFEHFMLKEIFEEPKALHDTLLGRLAEPELDSFFRDGYTGIKLVACGTSYHAALVGKYILEEVARIPTTAELASEYRYSKAPSDRPLVILLSQSGETADTLGACREANRRGCKTFAITNIIGSSLSREAQRTMLTRAGIEIGVAATKTFVAQLAALYLLAIRIGLERATLGVEEANRLKEELRGIPRAVQAVLNQAPDIEGLAPGYAKARDVFFIRRHIEYPIAIEGALKLKEISYVHAEAYAAGELKHGPLALVGTDTPG